jgi:hypothetical protein
VEQDLIRFVKRECGTLDEESMLTLDLLEEEEQT